MLDKLRLLDAALLEIAKESGDRRRRTLCVLNELFCGDGREFVDAALEVLRTRTVKRVVARPSAREFFALDPIGAQPGANGCYVCFADFCSCAAFLDSAQLTHGSVLCKHMLAARIAPNLSTLETTHVADADYHSAISSRYTL